jgi:hypothetical protein
MTKAGAAPLGPSPFKAGKYLLTCKKSNKVLEVANSSASTGANVQQNQIRSSTSPSENQLWRFDSAGTGVYRIVNVHSGLCLGTTSNSIKDAANVEQQTITSNSDTQRWKPVGAGGNYYAFVNTASGKCLDVLDLSTQNGANVIIYSYLRTENQQWLLEEKSATTVIENSMNVKSSNEMSVVLIQNSHSFQVLSVNTKGLDRLIIGDLQGKTIGTYLITGGENGVVNVQAGSKLPKGMYIVKLKKNGQLLKIVKVTMGGI